VAHHCKRPWFLLQLCHYRVEEEVQHRIAALPTGRRNQPEDIAAMAAFLASVDADNIAGQAYNVDGGAVMIA
jgi:NAD(P)-dependent dehydrogenase (short-subunit alcohol dehydrogenase family)